MALALWRLPRFLVLDPLSTVRIGLRLDSPACEIDVALQKPHPGKSFVLLLGDAAGHVVQRVRLSGRARVYFDPESAGEYQLLLANPTEDALTVQLKAHNVPDVPRVEIKRRASPRSKAESPSSRTPKRSSRNIRLQ
jgi:hypothetical protein